MCVLGYSVYNNQPTNHLTLVTETFHSLDSLHSPKKHLYSYLSITKKKKKKHEEDSCSINKKKYIFHYMKIYLSFAHSFFVSWQDFSPHLFIITHLLIIIIVYCCYTYMNIYDHIYVGIGSLVMVLVHHHPH